MYDYLHIIKTKAYRNDSRLLKWISSLNCEDKTSTVFILEDENLSKTEMVEKTEVEYTSLLSRRYFKKSKGFFLKIPEFSWKTIKHIKRKNVKNIVFHDVQHYLTLLVLCVFKPRNRTIIWDLHELFHEALLRWFLSRKILEFILSRVDCVIYTNEYRRKYTLERLNYKEKEYFILNNYTDINYIRENKKEIPSHLKKWLLNDKYIIWLGDGLQGRNFISFLKAFLTIKNKYKLVMLGEPDKESVEFIKNNNLKERIFQTFVKPERMLNYIDNAVFSVVLYKHSSPNNFYCEPNRLYQLTGREVPVIVGNNPQMVNLVRKYKAGLILNDDGSDYVEMTKAFEIMGKELNNFRNNLKDRKIVKELSWENQFDNIYSILEKL